MLADRVGSGSESKLESNSNKTLELMCMAVTCAAAAVDREEGGDGGGQAAVLGRSMKARTGSCRAWWRHEVEALGLITRAREKGSAWALLWHSGWARLSAGRWSVVGASRARGEVAVGK